MDCDFDWFKKDFFRYLKDYKVDYRFFEQGDYGYLNQVIFNCSRRGGEIDFWEDGTFSLHMWDFEKDKELLNILLKPNESFKRKYVFEQLKEKI